MFDSDSIQWQHHDDWQPSMTSTQLTAFNDINTTDSLQWHQHNWQPSMTSTQPMAFTYIITMNGFHWHHPNWQYSRTYLITFWVTVAVKLSQYVSKFRFNLYFFHNISLDVNDVHIGYTPCLGKNYAKLFLLELRRISTNLNNFW